MAHKEKWPEKVERLLLEGRPWRAKEVLRGNIASAGFDHELYRRYAELLVELGEELEAGKYFLLAGVETERANLAIRLYLHRRRRWSGFQLYQDFPAGARLDSLDGYPAGLTDALRRRGLDSLPRPAERRMQELEKVPRPLVVGCWVVGVAVLLCGAVGAFVILRGLVGLFTG